MSVIVLQQTKQRLQRETIRLEAQLNSGKSIYSDDELEEMLCDIGNEIKIINTKLEWEA